MPKLKPEQVAAAVDQGYEAKSEDLKALPCANGEAYVYKLLSCTDGLSKSSNRPQWTWELTLDGRYHPELVGAGYLERLWQYTPVEGGQEWAIAKMLHAFGYSPDTHTDELINEEATVVAYVSAEMYGTPPKPKMRARRFAQHYEDEFPATQSPMEIEAEEQLKAAAAAQAAAAVAAKVTVPDVPPVADTDGNDEF